MTSEEDRKLLLLETLVNNQKHMIELLSILNNNVEELILDLKDIKTTNLASSSSSSSENHNLNTNNISNNTIETNTNTKKHNQNSLNANSNSSSNSSTSSSTSSSANSNEILINHHHHPMHAHQMQANQNRLSLNGIDAIDLDANTASLTVSRQHNNFINTNSNRLENISPNNDTYKSVKTGLREFSTFVSKMVRQEFGCNFLALTRINELDRYVMQRIRDEAIAKYLPTGISPQFAWNHAMNSLRQLRHRQCKKAKLPL